MLAILGGVPVVAMQNTATASATKCSSLAWSA
jgi:hypothetical protein